MIQEEETQEKSEFQVKATSSSSSEYKNIKGGTNSNGYLDKDSETLESNSTTQFHKIGDSLSKQELVMLGT